jgi:hypothetical protein
MRTNYDLSTIMVNDENLDGFGVKSKECKFIDRIRYKNENYIITMRKFLELHDDAFYNILLYCSDFYDEFYKSHAMVTERVNHIMRNKFIHVVEGFKKVYDGEFEVYEYYLHYNKKIKSLDLMIKSKILTDRANSTYTFSMVFKYTKGEPLLQVWKMDMKKKKEVAFWIASEVENVRALFTYLDRWSIE